MACLLVPDLPLAAELRARPEWASRPWIVVSAPGSRSFVVSASPEARRQGVHAGASLVHARAVCSELRVKVASPALQRAARDTLEDVALSFSPRVASDPPAHGVFAAEAAVFLDASGIGTLFRSEETFATALAARAASLGLPSVACVASSRVVARLTARRLALEGETERVRVIPSGRESDFLAPLPIDLLDPPDGVAQSLTRFGIRTVGELLALPAASLITRLGPEAGRLLARVRGEQAEPPLPRSRETRCEEALDLEYPIDQLEPLGFVLRGLLSRLVARLDLRGLASGALELRMQLAGGRCDARRIGVAAPTNEVRTLLRLLSLALEQRPPDAPVTSVSLGTRGRPARREQLDLFRPAGPAPADLSRTLAELEALCGEGRVGAPAVRDEHRPDAFSLRPFAPHADGAATVAEGAATVAEGAATVAEGAVTVAEAPATAPPALRLGLRALRPPQPAEVTAPGGCPQWVRSRVANGRVVARSGPWRTTGGWWSPGRHHAFDHWDAETSDGAVVRLRYDRNARRWEIDGLYD
jgi:protein ImuB